MIVTVVSPTPDSGTDRLTIARTARLVLTTWSPVDVEPLLEMHSDPEAMKYVRFGRPETRSEVGELVQSYVEGQMTHGWTKWRLTDLDGELVGRAGFGGDDTMRGIACAIRRSHWGRGLATEIAEALVDWHATHAPAVRLRGVVMVGNDASVRVLEKTGFTEVGTEDFHGDLCRMFIHPKFETPRCRSDDWTIGSSSAERHCQGRLRPGPAGRSQSG